MTAYGFIARILLFFAPLGILAGIALGTAYFSGEIMPYDQVLALQAQDPVLIFSPDRFNTRDNWLYKHTGAQHHRADLLILGSSRMMTLRSTLFNRQPDQVYNAGITAARPDALRLFLETLPQDAHPNVILLGVDTLFLSVNQSGAAFASAPVMSDLDRGRALRGMIQKLLRGNITLAELWAGREPLHGHRALGLTALNRGRGFRYDGSRQTFTQREIGAPLVNDETFSPLPNADLDTDAFAALEDILAWAHQRDIVVIGVMMPNARAYHDRLLNNPDYAYYFDIVASVEALFGRHSYALYDFGDLEVFGVGDEEMYDTIHATERLAARVVARITADNPTLAAYVDVERLNQRIAESASPVTGFDAP